MPNHPTHSLHLGFGVVDLLPHGHAFIRTQLIHSEPLCVKSKEAISLVVSGASQKHLTDGKVETIVSNLPGLSLSEEQPILSIY